MKPLKSLILIFISIIAFSCSSDDDSSSNDDVQGGQDGLITAQVDGSDFESLDAVTFATIQSNVLNISGTNSNGDNISFLINNFDTGTFDLSGATLQGTAIYLPSGENTFYSSVNEGGSGTITVSEYDEDAETISATFNFTAVRASDSDTVEVTNGSFSNLTL